MLAVTGHKYRTLIPSVGVATQLSSHGETTTVEGNRKHAELLTIKPRLRHVQTAIMLSYDTVHIAEQKKTHDCKSRILQTPLVLH